jgi:hypothetical protein
VRRFSIIAGGLVVVLGIWLAVDHRPVLLKVTDPREPFHGPAFALFHPFRDRGPEHAADVFLQQLKDGKCAQAMAETSEEKERVPHICDREKTYPLQSWKLRDRSDKSGDVLLSYWFWRENYPPEGHGLIGIAVERSGQRWKVHSYSVFY